MRDRPGAVLFMCGRNAIRSPMAEAIARHLFPRSLYVASAGVVPGESDAFVEAALAEIDLSLGAHRPHGLDDLEDLNFDLIVTLSPVAHHRALELTRTNAIDVEYWPMSDPSVAIGTRDQILAGYRDLRDRLWTRISTSFG